MPKVAGALAMTVEPIHDLGGVARRGVRLNHPARVGKHERREDPLGGNPRPRVGMDGRVARPAQRDHHDERQDAGARDEPRHRLHRLESKLRAK